MFGRIHISEQGVDPAKICEPETIQDVKPADCGMSDESWFIGRFERGWVAWSDFGDHCPAFFKTEDEAREYWHEAAEAERDTH